MTEDIQARARQWLADWDGDIDERVTEGARVIRDLLAEVERRQWQPIETAPKDGTIVLLYRRREGENTQFGWWSDYYEEWMSSRGSSTLFTQPTHWQPLPEPPR